MLRIVDGIVYESKTTGENWIVNVHDLGRGHREVSVREKVYWVESCELDPNSINAQVLRGERDDPNAEEKRRWQKLRSLRRSKTRCRRVCKALGLDSLLTLTYRGNQGDLGLCKRHFELFVKRMRNTLGKFYFAACFQEQKRGAWHVHLATRRIAPVISHAGVKVKSWELVRRIWRSVTADWGGNIDFDGKRGRGVRAMRGYAKRSPAWIAQYISRYITSDWEDWPDDQRRLQTSPCPLNPPDSVEVVCKDLGELIALAFAFGADKGAQLVTAKVGRFRDTFFLASEGAS